MSDENNNNNNNNNNNDNNHDTRSISSSQGGNEDETGPRSDSILPSSPLMASANIEEEDNPSSLGSPLRDQITARNTANNRNIRNLDDEIEDNDEESIESDNDNDDGILNEREREAIIPLGNLEPGGFESDEEDGDDLIGDGMERDYAAIAQLDQYDENLVDNRSYAPMSAAQRARVEAHLALRDRQEGRRGVLPEALDDLPDTVGPVGRQQALIRAAREGVFDEADQEVLDEVVQIDQVKGSLSEWIMIDQNRREIHRLFESFLRSFVDMSGSKVYVDRISSMAAANKSSLEVNYFHLTNFRPTLAMWVADVPTELLSLFDEVATRVTLSEYPNYSSIAPDIHVRITDIPIQDKIRDLRKDHLNGLIKVTGVVTRRSGVFPQLKHTKFDCMKCGFTIGPIAQNFVKETKPKMCPQCQSSGPFALNFVQTVYRNYQKLTLQETPGSVPPGRLPRYKEVILVNDLIDCVRPGEEIEVTGVYKNTFDSSLNSKNGFPVFATVIEANYISKQEDQFASFRLTEDDKKQILALSKEPNIGKRLIASIAPSIYGHEYVKTALALSMFGGVAKTPEQGHRTRGDINVLLLGDPGVAKSQFLKYVEKTAHRAVFTTGQGASAVGLTASVHKDPVTREWTLEGGALVLADQGICMIDEFDKMNDQDRTSIHEAMEQQSISVSKAGIVTTLQARCSIIAAANPIRGRYDPTVSFSENVELTEPILSRFDVLCVLRDTVNPVIDGALAEFVVSSHIRSHPDTTDAEGNQITGVGVGVGGLRGSGVLANVQPISQDLLRKYIMYAKMQRSPKLTTSQHEKIREVYVQLRDHSTAKNGGISITTRHLEAMIRISEAHAKMHMRATVEGQDVDMAIRIMLEGFISAQKYSIMRSLQNDFGKYITHDRDHNGLLLSQLQEMTNREMTYEMSRGHGRLPDFIRVSVSEFEQKAVVDDLSTFYNSRVFKQHYNLSEDKRYIIQNLS